MSDELTEPRKDRRGAPPGSHRNPPHIPTDEQRRQVETMAGLQVSQAEIALVMGFSADTIQRHYAAEFERGRALQGITLRKHAYNQAYGVLKDPDHPELGYKPEFMPSEHMTRFMLERQFGMVQQTRQEHVGDPDRPVEIRSIRRMVIDPKAAEE